MSTQADHRRPIRIIAFQGGNVPSVKTVNIKSTAPSDPHHSVKEHLQLTAAQAKVPDHPTFMDSGGSIAGLPTIFINGYAGPN